METLSKNQRKACDYVKVHGLTRPRDLIRIGVHPQDIHRLCEKGLLVRVSRGLYELVETEPVSNQSLIEVCKRVEQGVICLLSALRFHEIGTQLPHKVWVAIPNNGARPRIENPPLEIIYLSDRMYKEGIETHVLVGGTVKVYGAAKTVVDCFRFRNKIGLDVALEALRDVLRHRKTAVDEIAQIAKTCRIWNVVRPYVEAMVAR